MLNCSLASAVARQIVPAITSSLLELVDKTLDAFESKARVVIKGAKYFFFTNMIRALVKSKLWPNETELYKKQAVDRIATFAYNIISRQADSRNDRPNQVSTLSILIFTGLLLTVSRFKNLHLVLHPIHSLLLLTVFCRNPWTSILP